MIVALLSLFALQAAAPAALHPAPVNSDFERVDESGRPAGWLPNPDAAGASYAIEAVPGENGGRAVRIVRREGAPANGAQRGGLMQRIDAAPYRGRIVRLRARIRTVRPGRHVGLFMLVRRPPPKIAGFQDTMADRPVTAGEWRSYELRGRVAQDAVSIEIGVSGAGDAEFLFDDLSLEIVEPDPAPPSPEAAAYLDNAIAQLRRLHIDSPTADWDRIIADARAEIGGARTPADTYPAIRGVIGALGEKHTFFFPPRPASAGGSGGGGGAGLPRTPLTLPGYRLVDGRYGMVLVPSHMGTDEESQRYVATLRTGLLALDRQGVCGWIVDLRGNGGGNMWPMLSGLDPLLGDAPFGSFVIPSAASEQWVRYRGEIRPGPASDRRTPFFSLGGADLPVAVLIDGGTASAGEMTAIALIGRDRVRTFGSASAGWTTANQPVELPDGATFALTSAFVRDRQGRDYRDTIVPDEPAEDAQAAAIRWLGAQPCRR